MAKGRNSPSASSVKRSSEKSVLPFRRFVDRPTTPYIDALMKFLRETASPELHEDLFRNPIAKEVQFYILRKVHLDGKRRPSGDNAPCPMCSTNKFLSGALVHIPELQCCAVIGHCCAGKDAQAAADREYRERKKRDHEEGYLLENLTLVPARMKVLDELRPVAIDARRLYREFRKGASKVQHQLRQVRLNHAGRLVLQEIIRGGEDDEPNDYVGPAGFRSRGADIETRDHDFGLLAGGIATIKNYDPVAELDWIIRQLGSINEVPTEESIIEFIADMNEQKRGAAVAIMESVDSKVHEFAQRISDFLSFFTHENAGRLDAYGTSNHNSAPFAVAYGELKGKPTLLIRHNGEKCSLQVGDACKAFTFVWPQRQKAQSTT
jgi:hypothetical protein